LLRAAVEREGSQTAFAKRHGVNRVLVNMILNGKTPVSGGIAKVLGLRKMYVAE
jgi:plasmid maintenance system antidote protein VapI